jgi:hypothetical protein
VIETVTAGQEVRRVRVAEPVFSICIPQHNRTSFIIEACRALVSQNFKDFELCISDDCSTDGREYELLRFLDDSGLSFSYRRQTRNLRYDANLRAAIDLARGKFVFLMGNDDCLAGPSVLGNVLAEIERNAPVSVVLTNYEDFASGRRVARQSRGGIVGRGPAIAVQTFRNFSFVSGVVLDTTAAQQHATARWDGSEMYQVFVATRIIASGGALLYVDLAAVRKDVQIPGESVDSYAARPPLDPCPIVTRLVPLGQLVRLVSDAIEPYVEPRTRGRLIERAAIQLYRHTYPFWIVEYRRVQSWRFALGICLGLRPRHSLHGLMFPRRSRMWLTMLFWTMSAVALALPVAVFDRLQNTLYRVAKAST